MQVLSIIKKVIKILGFVVLFFVGLALILILLSVGILVSPIILIGYFWKTYFNYKHEKNKINAKLKLKLEGNIFFAN